MAIMKKWFFDIHSKPPCATVVYYDKNEELKLFEVRWDEAAVERWQFEMLPRLCTFYFYKFLDAARKYLAPPSVALAATPSNATASAAVASAAVVFTPQATAKPIEESAPESSDVDQTPTLTVNKVVYDGKQKKRGTVLAIRKEKGDQQAQISWHSDVDDGTRRKSWRKVSELVVQPMQSPVKPQKLGDRVLINTGSKYDLVGQKGVVLEIHIETCTILLESNTKVTVKLEHCHCLSDHGKSPTVPLGEPFRMKPENFFERIEKYQRDNKVKLINIPSQAILNEAIEQYRNRKKLRKC